MRGSALRSSRQRLGRSARRAGRSCRCPKRSPAPRASSPRSWTSSRSHDRGSLREAPGRRRRRPPACASAPSGLQVMIEVMDVVDPGVGKLDRGDAFRAVAGAPERHQQGRRARREVEIGRADDVGGRHRFDATPGDARDRRRKAFADEGRGARARSARSADQACASSGARNVSMPRAWLASSAWVARSVPAAAGSRAASRARPLSADSGTRESRSGIGVTGSVIGIQRRAHMRDDEVRGIERDAAGAIGVERDREILADQSERAARTSRRLANSLSCAATIAGSGQ